MGFPLVFGAKGYKIAHLTWAIEALRVLNGPRRPFRLKPPNPKGWRRGPGYCQRSQKALDGRGTPRPKIRVIGLGVGEVVNWPKKPMGKDMARENECDPKANWPRTDNMANWPRTDNMANWPRIDNMANWPRTDNMANWPRTDNMANWQYIGGGFIHHKTPIGRGLFHGCDTFDALSSIISESLSMLELLQDLLWLKTLVKDFKITMPIELWCENLWAIALCQNPLYNHLTCHIDI
ncbi:hypothetical protein O181_040671 [Austropuccinia psidii MF-1]|uniref:Uncharacterized protein n=1 Tax=Austropuccinia psidii MF-1 TaxID=1389203 RepID=A0A9Q3DBS1_9BASI|nr:hypothetical protein [Austropuccinia psidii MF-1]